MAVEYDLVILGGTPLGRQTALAAAQYQARVALVEPSTAAGWLTDITFHTLRHWGQIRSSHADGASISSVDTAFMVAQQQAKTLQELPSIVRLQSLGIDVLEGDAEFRPRPRLGIQVGERLLRSRTYLLLRPHRTLLPNIPGLDNVQPLLPEDLWTSDLWTQPSRRVTLLGSGAIACALAQLLARFGHQVTLITETPLLPEHDADAVRLLQAVLEAEGVSVVAPTSVARIWAEAGQPMVETVLGPIAGDILLATGPSLPEVSSLNPGAIGLELVQGRLPTNARLQTRLAPVYACDTPASAPIALKNALFMPIFRMPQEAEPQVVWTDPPLVSFGLTQAQAQQRYGTRYHRVRDTFLGQTMAHAQQKTTGLYEILVRPTGQVIGGWILGPAAEEWAGLFLLAQRHRIPLQKLAHLSLPSPSFAAGVQAIAQSWQTHQLKQHPWLLRRLDHWFDARRSWMR